MLRCRTGNVEFPLFLSPLFTALQVGVNHVPLDRTGSNDRNFDHQVIEFSRLQARQHVHLRPALDLEDPDGIALTEHVVDG